MTFMQGLGLLFTGLTVMLIGGAIIHYVINKYVVPKNNKEK